MRYFPNIFRKEVHEGELEAQVAPGFEEWEGGGLLFSERLMARKAWNAAYAAGRAKGFAEGIERATEMLEDRGQEVSANRVRALNGEGHERGPADG